MNRRFNKNTRRYSKAGNPCPICHAPVIWEEHNGKWKLVCPTPENHLDHNKRLLAKRDKQLTEYSDDEHTKYIEELKQKLSQKDADLLSTQRSYEHKIARLEKRVAFLEGK